MFAELQALEIKETPPELYNGIKLFLVVQGTVTVSVAQSSTTLRRGDLLLVNRYEMHAVAGAPSNAVLQLSVPYEYLQQEGPSLLYHSFRLQPGGQDSSAAQAHDEIRQILYYMLIVQHNRNEGYELELRANLFRLLHLLLQHFQLGATEPRQIADCCDSNIRAVISVIHEQFRQPLSLEQLAKRQFLSTHYLSRLFKEQTGTGFLEYLTRVRLESARKDLLYTKDSVIQIALHNGFPSAQAFAGHFKRLYGTTPTDFRGSFENAPTTVTRFRIIPFQQLCGLSEIVKHIGGYEQESGVGKPETEVSAAASTTEFFPCDKVLKIGRLSWLLHEDVRRQLVQVQEKIQFQYIHFCGVFNDGLHQGPTESMFWGCDYSQIFPFLERLGLRPILRIDLDFLSRNGISPEQAQRTLEAFFENYSPSITGGWLYELYCSSGISAAECSAYYQRLHSSLKRHSHKLSIGIFLDWSEGDGESGLSKWDCASFSPDFITLAADPNPGYHQLEGDAAEQFIRCFYPNLFQELRAALGNIVRECIPVLLLEWNTLIGRNLQECASFYRAALVAESLLQFCAARVIPAFWLSEQISEISTQPNSGVLSLFHCLDLKRSLFYALCLFSKLGTRLLYQENGLLVTLDAHDRFVVLGYHPCYFAPIHAMDFDFVKRFSRETGILLSNLPNGDYQIKAFRLAMNFSYAVNDGESFFRLPNINVPHYYSDPDSQEYLSVIAAPQYSLFQEHIDGSCKLNFDLSFNSLKLYLIDKS